MGPYTIKQGSGGAKGVLESQTTEGGEGGQGCGGGDLSLIGAPVIFETKEESCRKTSSEVESLNGGQGLDFI